MYLRMDQYTHIQSPAQSAERAHKPQHPRNKEHPQRLDFIFLIPAFNKRDGFLGEIADCTAQERNIQHGSRAPEDKKVYKINIHEPILI